MQDNERKAHAKTHKVMSEQVERELVKPYCVQVELTEGCSIQCQFCGIQGIREKPGNYKFMTCSLAYIIARGLRDAVSMCGWNPRVEFAMHGEPTVNPDVVEIVSIFRKQLPKTSLLMLTNGSGLAGGNTTKKIDTLFDSGLNTLGVEEYGHTTFHETIKRKYTGDALILHYPSDKNANPHARQKPESRRLVYIADIFSASRGNHSNINTHCGTGSPPPETALTAPCAKVFRELSIRWDGKIAICCNDWRGTYGCGDVYRASIPFIWYNRRFRAARAILYDGQRNLIAPCSKCDELSYRVGLIPDPKGVYAYEPWTKQHLQVIEDVERNRPYTEAVKRPWEK
jgi:hypothetical protein